MGSSMQTLFQFLRVLLALAFWVAATTAFSKTSSSSSFKAPFGVTRRQQHGADADSLQPRTRRPRRRVRSRVAPSLQGRPSVLPLFATADETTETSSSQPVRIIIAGAPASGKGTQCELIKQKFGVVHLSTGDMLREAVAAKTEVGQKAKEYMDSGMLVPDEVIIGVVKDRLAESDCLEHGWLLDGFPRTKAQADALADAGICADCFIFLNVPDEILVERVVGRRTDPETGKIYHLTFSPPPADDAAILARLVHRSDDTEEKVQVRLEQFHANVEAIKDSYTEISVTIDGNQTPSTVSSEIFAAVEAQLSKVTS